MDYDKCRCLSHEPASSHRVMEWYQEDVYTLFIARGTLIREQDIHKVIHMQLKGAMTTKGSSGIFFQHWRRRKRDPILCDLTHGPPLWSMISYYEIE